MEIGLRHTTTLLLTAFALIALLALSARAGAQSVRVVVVADQVLDGHPRTHRELETVAITALQARGVRVVELDAALRAQQLAFSASLQAGTVPNALTVLNADAAISLRLRCDKSADAVMGSKLVAYYCVLASKLVRLATGDVVHSENVALTGHGLNATMAVQSVLDARLGAVLQDQAAHWLLQLAAADRWEADLVLTGLSDRATASALGARLAELPLLEAARLVVWNVGTAKYVLTGRGKLALDQLADRLESDSDLALTVTFHADRTLHAEYDFAKAYRRRVVVMSVSATHADAPELEAHVLTAALMNLPYLEMAHSRPLLATPKTERKLTDRLRAKANEIGAPLVLVCSLAQRGSAFVANLRLLHAASGRTVATASGEAPGLAEAVDQAARAFDGHFRTALGQASTRTRLGLESDVVQRASASGLVIRALRVPPQQVSTANAARAVLELDNTSNDTLEDVRMVMEAAGKRVLDQALPKLAPHASLVLPLGLGAIAVGEEGCVSLAVTLTYRQGERRGLSSAFASLVDLRAIAPPTAGAPPTESETLLHEGLADSFSGRFDQARKLISHAHALQPSARTLNALGEAEFDLGKRDQAALLLRQALASSVHPLTDQQRLEALLLLDRIH